MILLSLAFAAGFTIVVLLGYLSEPKQRPPKPSIPISIYFVHLTRWIEGCERPRQLVVANRMVDAFKERYKNDKLLSYYATKLCCSLQNKRIEITLNNARKSII